MTSTDKIVKFSLLILLQIVSTTCINVRGNELLILITEAYKDIDINEILNTQYTDSIELEKGDFSSLIESKNINKDHIFVSYFDRKTGKEQNFSILFSKKYDIYIGLIFVPDFESDFSGYLSDNVILIDAKTNSIICVRISELIEAEFISKTNIPNIPTPKEVIRRFNLRQDINYYDILWILKLDSFLNPQTRINFINGKLISFSKIMNTPEGYKENMSVYSTVETEDIGMINLSQLYLILRMGSKYDSIINCTVIPDYLENRPFWLGLSQRYK